MDIIVEKFGTKTIAIKGVAEMFFQEGLPIPIQIHKLRESGIEVSILHVADGCLKNGWSPKTTVRKLKDDFSDSGEPLDIPLLERFCYADYESQREMIFEYLFKDRDEATNWLRTKITPNP